MKVSEFCYEMHFHYRLPLITNKLDFFPIRIEINHGSHMLYPVLIWVTLLSLHFIPRFRSA
jgi:hypothetical protein